MVAAADNNKNYTVDSRRLNISFYSRSTAARIL